VAGTLTAITQTAWPTRVQLTASGLGNAFWTINRVVGGARTPVRGADDQYIYPATAAVVIDAELPFGVPVTYELIEAGATVDTEGPTTYTLAGGNVALTDAVNGLSAEVAIGAIDELDADTSSAVYNIDGINRVVSSKISQPGTTVEYFTATLTARDNLRALLAGCQDGTYQQRAPSPAYDADAYYAVLRSRERRFSQDGTDERRITAVQVAETTTWPSGMEARGFTLQDIADAYTGLTLAAIAADYATLLAVAQGDYS
jgi:hypothetical protein